MACWELANIFQESCWAGEETVGEELHKRHAVDLVADHRVLFEASNLGCEGEQIRLLDIEQGLLAKAVTRQKQALAQAVVDGKGKHAIQAMHKFIAPFGIAVNQDLGIRMACEKAMSPLGEFPAKFSMIVDHAVEDDGKGAVGMAHRLVTFSQVDNGKAAMTEKDAHVGIRNMSVSVWASMRLRVGHVHQDADIARSCKTGNAAHTRPPTDNQRLSPAGQGRRKKERGEPGIPGGTAGSRWRERQ